MRLWKINVYKLHAAKGIPNKIIEDLRRTKYYDDASFFCSLEGKGLTKNSQRY